MGKLRQVGDKPLLQEDTPGGSEDPYTPHSEALPLTGDSIPCLSHPTRHPAGAPRSDPAALSATPICWLHLGGSDEIPSGTGLGLWAPQGWS